MQAQSLERITNPPSNPSETEVTKASEAPVRNGIDNVNTVMTGLKWTGGLVTAYWGGLAGIIQAMLILMALDIVTGILAALILEGYVGLSSRVSWRGILRKTLAVIMVLSTKILFDHLEVHQIFADLAVGGPGERLIPNVLRPHLWIAGFYCVNEAISITENLNRAGVPVPAMLESALRKISQRSEMKKAEARGEVPTPSVLLPPFVEKKPDARITRIDEKEKDEGSGPISDPNLARTGPPSTRHPRRPKPPNSTS